MLGAEIIVECLSEAGTRIDFEARFADVSISVEAISPIFNEAVELVARDRLPLLNIIEDLVPEGWSVIVADLPQIGPSDSKREFKAIVHRMFRIAPPVTFDDEEINLYEDHPKGLISLVLVQRCPGWPVIVSQSQFWSGDNSEKRIRHAIKEKRIQAKNSPLATLVAIGVNVGTGITRLDAFDRALLATSVANYVPGKEMQAEWRLQGEFAALREGEPTHAGVLAFPRVSLGQALDPVLYHHPRSTRPLPSALLNFEQRRLVRNPASIVIEAALRTDVLAALNPLADNLDNKSMT
jgi:hypothetical protein